MPYVRNDLACGKSRGFHAALDDMSTRTSIYTEEDIVGRSVFCSGNTTTAGGDRGTARGLSCIPYRQTLQKIPACDGRSTPPRLPISYVVRTLRRGASLRVNRSSFCSTTATGSFSRAAVATAAQVRMQGERWTSPGATQFLRDP